MDKRSHKIKVISIATILIFILIPLLSSPVSAGAHTFASGAGISTNTNPPAACTVAIGMVSPLVTPAGAPPNTVTVTFSYTFVDSNAGPLGSDHICNMRVTEPTSGTNRFVSTGLTFIPAGTSTSATLSSGPIAFAATPPSLTFTVYVDMTVRDRNAARTMSGWGSTTVQFT